jgi:DNA-binding response OmpR family regulator
MSLSPISTAPAPRNSRPRVLVVDDNAEARFIMRSVLTTMGLEVVEATCGGEALRRTRDEPFGLVILDLGLPDIDGLRLLEWLADTARTLPVCVTSARRDPASVTQAASFGCESYLVKPIKAAELKARVAGLLWTGRRKKPKAPNLSKGVS